MQNETVLPLVLYGTTAVYVVAGVLSMLMRPNLYDQIGQGGLCGGSEESRDGELHGHSLAQATNRAEREREVRQMLQARNDRLVRGGHAPLDIDAELSRLERLDATRGDPRDEALVEEVRQLVIARNERRVRQGLAALDLEPEIERALTELDPAQCATITSCRPYSRS
ncbi:MAG TPA: hypothetical protein VK756_02730 [Solirubrobacteraceae bacterium]|nr:hypothetical protein [Solirubrobacteraceae bacterium]